jgi:hypothetical protein
MRCPAAKAAGAADVVEEGGTLLAIGGSTGFDHYFGLPLSNALIDASADGEGGRLPTTKFYIPGSVLQASVDNTLPIAYGLPDKVDVFYMKQPGFPSAARSRRKGNAAHRVVWRRGAAAERLGLGAALPEWGGGGGGRRRRKR